MIATIRGVVQISDPDPVIIDEVSSAITALAEQFPENDITHLGGITDGQTSAWFARGFTKLRELINADDQTYSGPYIEIDYDRSKLDARFTYQEPFVKKALASPEGILVSPTGSGKTVIETMIICHLKRRALVLTHTTEIARQIAATFKALTGVEPGSIYGGVRDVRPVTIGLIQSVRSYDPILQDIGTLLIDEAHHISSPSYLAILKTCPARYRYGLTATDQKTGSEEKIIHAAIGPVLAKIPVKELQSQGFINRGVVRPIYTGAVGSWFDFVSSKCWFYRSLQRGSKGKTCPSPCTYPQTDSIDKCVMERGYLAWVYKKLSTDEIRNARIVGETAKAVKEYPWTIVITHRKDHAAHLYGQLKKVGGFQVQMAVGQPEMSLKERRTSIDNYVQSGGVLVATSAVIGEGFNAPKTGCLVRAMPSGGKVSVRQQTGRIMRPQDRPSLVIDFVDAKIPRLKRMWMGRKSIYKAIGFEEASTVEEGHLF